MKNKLSISLILLNLIIFIMPFSLAQVSSFGTFKQNQAVNLIQTYNASYCNITSITSPNSTIYIGGLMTKSGGSFNYTFSLTSESGSYTICGNCDTTPWCANIDITPSGIIATSAQGNLSIGLLIGIILIMFFFGLIAFKLMDYEKLYPIAVFFLLVAIILAIYGLYLGVIFSRDYLFASTSAPQSALFIGTLWGLVGMMFIALLWLVIAVVKEIRERKSLQKYGESWDNKTKSYKY
jgi:hypothetical protein